MNGRYAEKCCILTLQLLIFGRYLSATWDVEAFENKKEEIVEGDKLKVKLVV